MKQLKGAILFLLVDIGAFLWVVSFAIHQEQPDSGWVDFWIVAGWIVMHIPAFALIARMERER